MMNEERFEQNPAVYHDPDTLNHTYAEENRRDGDTAGSSETFYSPETDEACEIPKNPEDADPGYGFVSGQDFNNEQMADIGDCPGSEEPPETDGLSSGSEQSLTNGESSTEKQILLSDEPTGGESSMNAGTFSADDASERTGLISADAAPENADPEPEEEEPFTLTSEDLHRLVEQMQQKNDVPRQEEEEEEDQTDYPAELKTVTTRSIVAAVAFLIGVRKQTWEDQYREDNPGLLENLMQDRDALLIRYLSFIRSRLMRNFKSVDEAIRFDLKNLDQSKHFDEVDFKQLAAWGFPVLKANYTATRYLTDVSRLINENIYRVQHLFPDWIKWEYIRDLFFIKNAEKPGVMQTERSRFSANRQLYPYGTYLHWKIAEDGNILYNDGKFLKLLYERHKDRFSDRSKYTDAAASAKNGIYDFIDRATKVTMVVDCENSDLFKLYSVLRGLDDGKLSKIDKIVLYDDEHTTEAWDWLEQLTHLTVEHIEVERIVDRKSLVDIEIAVGVCQSYYEDHVDSVILFSSDSDYWGLITSLPQVNYLVMYEFDKCGQAIKDALKEHEIYYCPMDNFCTWDVPTVQKLILFRTLEREFPYIIGRDPMEVTKEIYEKTRIFVSEEEQERFCSRYVKTLRTKIMDDGTLGLEIQK
ncbi:MAG: NYN domain-containing protein [Lachnospiraceae bacterium]|nr:NYN domain-containing protein [Lachnospiraceae bacterium]